MHVRFLGTAGPAGWPQPGCRCASCGRAAAAPRRPGGVLVDGRLRVRPGEPPGPADRYQVRALPGGWDITAPDGARLLAAAGPQEVPDISGVTNSFDLLLLDLLDSPEQLGALRARGLAPPGSVAAALFADHRVTSTAELTRRCALWGAVLPADGDALAITPGGPGPVPAPGGAAPRRTLIIGGARSGKSQEAELRLAAEPAVTYLAAGPYPDSAGPGDPEWGQRVAAHQARRPAWWRTEETTDVAGALRRLSGAVLVDSIGTWLTAVLTEAGAWPGPDGGTPAGPAAADRVAERVAGLVAAWRDTAARVIAVTDEVGSGVIPATPAGRLFRDELGALNQRLAAESEDVLLVVAGRPLAVPG